MRYGAKKLDMYNVQFQTSTCNSYLRNLLQEAESIKTDDDKKNRLEKSECKMCFYRKGRIGGCAMTEQPCGICGIPVMYGSTCTDVLCLNCAKEHELCKHCGADRELRANRRKFNWIS